MKNFILPILMLISITSYGQWTYSSGKSDFDGSYKTSRIVGSGGVFPYNKPVLVVNKFNNSTLNIYITNAGYSGCNDLIIYMKFNGEEKIYETSYVSSGVNNDAWFISSFKDLENYELIAKFMKHSFLSVRLNSSCSSVDYKFSLRGATRALNFVLGKNWLEQKKQEAKKQKLLDSSLIDEQRKKIEVEKKQKEKKNKEKNLKIYSFKKKQKSQMNMPLLNLEKQKNKADSIINNSIIKFSKKDFYVNKTDIKVYKNIYEVEEKFIIPRGTLIGIYDDYKHTLYFKLKYANEYFKIRRFFIEKSHLKKLFIE